MSASLTRLILSDADSRRKAVYCSVQICLAFYAGERKCWVFQLTVRNVATQKANSGGHSTTPSIQHHSFVNANYPLFPGIHLATFPNYTGWRWAFHEKLTVSQLIKEFSAVLANSSLPRSKQPSSRPYPQPDESNPHSQILAVSSPIYTQISEVVSFLQVCQHISFLLRVACPTCLLPLVAESFVFQFAIQKYKD